MFAYHYDVLGALNPGRICLQQDVFFSDEYFQNYYNMFFSEGLTPAGKLYFTPYTYSPNKQDETIELLDAHIVEAIFEYVRQQSFPDRPSRFQSLFAVKTKEAADSWGTILSQNLPSELVGRGIVRTIKYHTAFEADVNWRDMAIKDEIQRRCFSFPMIHANAHNYWSGKVTNMPNIELLLPFPITVIE